MKEDIRKTRKKSVSAAFNKVREIIAIVKTFGMNPLVQLAILLSNVLLVVDIERRVFVDIKDNLFLSPRIKEERLRLELDVTSGSRYGSIR